MSVFGVILAQMPENTDQNNSECGRFSRSDKNYLFLTIINSWWTTSINKQEYISNLLNYLSIIY